MQGSERYLEASEIAVESERDRAVDRIRRELEAEGDAYCRDCGDPIDVARKIALPSARRCVDCQARRERDGRR